MDKSGCLSRQFETCACQRFIRLGEKRMQPYFIEQFLKSLNRLPLKILPHIACLVLCFGLHYPAGVSAHVIGVVDQAAPPWFTTSSTGLVVSPKNHTAPAGNGTLMSSSFTPFKPKVRYSNRRRRLTARPDLQPRQLATPLLLTK